MIRKRLPISQKGTKKRKKSQIKFKKNLYPMKTACELRETTPIPFTASSNDFQNTELHVETDEDLITRRWLTGRGDELVSRYTVQCMTQKQNKTPRVYKAWQYTRCTCKMSSAMSCSLRVPRGLYVNQERVTEKACLRALCREMMKD